MQFQAAMILNHLHYSLDTWNYNSSMVFLYTEKYDCITNTVLKQDIS